MDLEAQLAPQIVVVAEGTNITDVLKCLRERWEMEAGENVCRILLAGRLALMDVMEALGVPVNEYDRVLGNTSATTNPVGQTPLYFIARY